MDRVVLSSLLRINRHHRRTLKCALAPYQYVGVMHLIVIYVSRSPGTSQEEIAGYFALDKTSVARDARRLEELGYGQYEISNFARPGFQSRHNLRYWLTRPYIGFGPGAHSDFGGRRYAWVRDLEGYITGVLEGSAPLLDSQDLIPQEERGSEYLMLRLRTTHGIEEWEYRGRYFMDFSPIEERLEQFAAQGWAERTAEGRWRLTPKGFLVSNQLIGDLLERQERASLDELLPKAQARYQGRTQRR